MCVVLLLFGFLLLFCVCVCFFFFFVFFVFVFCLFVVFEGGVSSSFFRGVGGGCFCCCFWLLKGSLEGINSSKLCV